MDRDGPVAIAGRRYAMIEAAHFFRGGAALPRIRGLLWDPEPGEHTTLNATLKRYRTPAGRSALAVVCSLALLWNAGAAEATSSAPPSGLAPKGRAISRANSFSAVKFDFGSGKTAKGCTQVQPTDVYSMEAGYGFEPGAGIVSVDRGGWSALQRDFCTSDKPFHFSIALPEGNYRVTVTLGDRRGESDTTIKSELRRLMLEQVRTAKGKFVTRHFTVNVRTPRIAGDGEVRLKKRERETEMWNWDEKLTLEFNGTRPCVCGLEIERADDLPTVFLLGDSTVCDQPSEPWNSWGQMLPRFLKPTVVVANHAQSGESLKSSLGAGRLDKVLSAMKPGDYLFIQYGHNDMKDRAPDALATYKSNLKAFVRRAREKGGLPVLVTSMERKEVPQSLAQIRENPRHPDSPRPPLRGPSPGTSSVTQHTPPGLNRDTLGEYPDTVRAVAREEGVALIDLNLLSKAFYRALGPEQIDRAFQDGTHHNNYGSYELAKCVVQGMREARLPLAKHIVQDFKGFDPGHPDAVEAFFMPPSPTVHGPKPLGD
jgi:lysophospholipase L1-like esterase